MKLPLAVPDLGPLERGYLLQAFDSTWLTSSGAFVRKVEEEQLSYLSGQSHNLLVANGTVALHLALLALGIGQGDEVIVPTLTYVASVNAIRYVGATPIFVDSDEYWVASTKHYEEKITGRTKALIAVHVYGHAVDMSAMRQLADKYGLGLVEDVAEGLLGKSLDILNGSVSDISTFSFYGNKLITSGEGGALATSNNELFQRAKLFRDQGMDSERRYFFPVVGYNYRITNLQAAILSAQIERVDEIFSLRISQAEEYTSLLLNVSNVSLQPKANWCSWSPWLFSILANSVKERNQIMHHLETLGVETRPFFIPVHTLPPYRLYSQPTPLAVSIELSNRGLNLPLGRHLTSGWIREIVDEIRSQVENPN